MAEFYSSKFKSHITSQLIAPKDWKIDLYSYYIELQGIFCLVSI